MANEFKVKNGLQINSTQAVIGIVNSSSFTYDSSNLATVYAIKGYADTKYPNSGGLISGDVSISGSLRIDGSTTFSASYLNVQGTVVIDGSLDMHNNRIYGVQTPINSSDAINKWYIDSSIGAMYTNAKIDASFVTVNKFDASISTLTISDNAKMASSAFSGLTKITVGTSQPGTPNSGDLWVDIS
jgi:hypothetical protein